MSQRLDAEDVRTVINAYFLRWQQHIDDNGGVVEKFIGDAVMAVFGLHKADEGDPHLAIRAALSMKSSLDDLNAGIASTYDLVLDMRVGIDTGEVVVSTLGDRPGQDFVVVGDVVNRASRLQSAAPHGGVLVSADTYRHVRGSFAVQPLTGLQLKGIAQPVDGYLVQSEQSRGFRLNDARGVEGVDAGRSTGDRAANCRTLLGCRRGQSVAGRDRLGDAGVGKSRRCPTSPDGPTPFLTRLRLGGGRPDRPEPPVALLYDLFTRFDINDSDAPSRSGGNGSSVEQALGPARHR